jgi:hypothetical protein
VTAQANPAAEAWTALTGRHVRAVHAVEINTKSQIYRLIDSAEGAVIAKRIPRVEAEREHGFHELVGSILGSPSLRSYGVAPDTDQTHRWLLLEDAGAARYDPAVPQHRKALARWLGRLHAAFSDPLIQKSLPDRASETYLQQLQAARRRLEPSHRAIDRRQRNTLKAAIGVLDRAEEMWAVVEERLSRLPATLVHGDLNPTNIRVVGRGRLLGVRVFDWEMSGVGPPGVDVAVAAAPSNGPMLDTYREVVRRVWPRVTAADVECAASGGIVLRWVAALEWESIRLASGGVERAVRRIAAFAVGLERALDPGLRE